LYENRVTENMGKMLEEIGQPFRPESKPTKMLIVSDGDVIRNAINKKENKIEPLGYNPYERYTFANKDFLLNAVEYLLDTDGVIASRSKEVRLRLLNKTKAREEKTKWQLVNIALPLLLLGIFGGAFTFLRRRRYG